jgi:hypothetical protein
MPGMVFVQEVRAVSRIWGRLESGERWWAAECVLRAIGGALLALSAAMAAWLHRTLPSAHSQAAGFAAAALAVTCLSLGLALLFEGPGLFRLLPVPGRQAHFPS